jgi:HSP20 family protein
MRRNCGYPEQHWGTVQDFLNTVFADVARNYAGREEAEKSDWRPAADVYETEESFVIALDAPGLDREKTEVELDETHLTIRGERAAENDKLRRNERPNGRFTRRFRVHAHVDRENIKAVYQDGVLRVTLPRQAKPESQRVKITVS